MKFISKNLTGLFMAGALLLGASPAGFAQATLSVSPSAISNTYPGVITLSITGLTNGEQVSIQKYLDVNGNGAVDPGEPMFDAFKIKDGGANVIGGVTNLNVPFDHNAATGAITTTLDFAPPRTLANLTGQYVFRVSSPGGNFAPLTATFTVTNAPLAQSVSGIIYSNGVTPLPNAVMVALRWPDTRYAGAVLTDGAGQYQLNLDPGSYVLMPIMPGYYTDQSIAAQVTLTNGMAATNNLDLTSSAVTISGSVYDATNLTPLGGVMMQLESGDLFAVAFTDTNGNYSATVAAGSWKVKVEAEMLAHRAYVVPQNGIQTDTTTGSVAGVNLALPKANALFYGRIADTNNLPFASIQFSAQDNFSHLDAAGFSAANGKYCVAVLAGTNAFHCSPDNSSPPLSAYLISSSFDTNISAGMALPQNFTVVPVSAQISGHLQDNLSHAVAGVGIDASATIGGVQFDTYADTDTNGNYSFSAAPGVWNIHVNCCGNDGLGSLGLVDTNTHSVTIPPTNAVVNITVAPPTPLSLAGGTLPRGYVNAGYFFSFGVSGGQPPYAFNPAPASGPVPPGLLLAGNGYISGTPTNGGTYNFTVRVNDQNSAIVDAAFSLTIDSLLQVLTTSLTNGAVGTNYSVQLQATGGQPAYTWYLATNSGSLPPGLSLSTNGLLSGIPGNSGTYGLMVQLYDSLSRSVTQPLSLTITTTSNPPPAGPLLSAPACNPDGSFQFGFTSAPGTWYTIQSSPDLYSWTSVFTFQSPGGPMLLVDPGAATGNRRFYRLKIGP